MTTTTTTTKATKSKKGEEKIGNIIFSKVLKPNVDAALKLLGVKAKGSLAARTQQLIDKFAELNEKQDLYVCDPADGGCGGEFTEDFELCPYCGLADEVAGEEEGALALPPEPLPKALAKYSDKDLDDDVNAIVELKQQTAICMWDLGALIKKNYDREFWKLRRDENGGPMYRNVKQFWAQELGFSHTYCYSLMEIAEHFEKDDVKEVGTSKLSLILRAPEKKRPGLLKAAKGGASKADIAKQVRAANSNGAATEADEGVERKRRLSIAVVPGRKTIRLFAKPKKAADEEEPKRAKKMGDLPWGEMLFDNNTKMTVKLADKNGEWVAIVEFDRAN